MGTRACAQSHEDRYATYIMNTVLGGSMSSRLFQNVREKRGLVYSISSGVASYSDAGVLTVYAGTSLESLDQVVQLTVAEFRRMRDEPVPAEELRRAKDHLKGSLMLSLENTSSRMNHMARQEIYFGRQFTLDEILHKIEAVSSGRRAAHRRPHLQGRAGRERAGQPGQVPAQAGAPQGLAPDCADEICRSTAVACRIPLPAVSPHRRNQDRFVPEARRIADRAGPLSLSSFSSVLPQNADGLVMNR